MVGGEGAMRLGRALARRVATVDLLVLPLSSVAVERVDVVRAVCESRTVARQPNRADGKGARGELTWSVCGRQYQPAEAVTAAVTVQQRAFSGVAVVTVIPPSKRPRRLAWIGAAGWRNGGGTGTARATGPYSRRTCR